MSKPGGLSKLGPPNVYAPRRICECQQPNVEFDDDEHAHCVKCGHVVLVGHPRGV